MGACVLESQGNFQLKCLWKLWDQTFRQYRESLASMLPVQEHRYTRPANWKSDGRPNDYMSAGLFVPVDIVRETLQISNKSAYFKIGRKGRRQGLGRLDGLR
jgi:hypothetical protein